MKRRKVNEGKRQPLCGENLPQPNWQQNKMVLAMAKAMKISILLSMASMARSYKVLSDVDHYQVDRNFCEIACFNSAETKVEALPGDAVEFNCRTDKEDVAIRKLWTTDGGQYVASSDKSFMERYFVSNNGSTLRIKPVSIDDDGKSLWCNLLVFDPEVNRWRPRKTIRHFLFVGEGKMTLMPEDLINLDIIDDNVLYHHKQVDEFDSKQKLLGNITASNISVENIFFNGTMEKDDLIEDVETDEDGTQEGTIKEEKLFLDMGEKFKKTIQEGAKDLQKKGGTDLSPDDVAPVRQARSHSRDVAPVRQADSHSRNGATSVVVMS